LIGRLDSEFVNILNRAEFKIWLLNNQDAEAAPTTPEELGTQIKAETSTPCAGH